MNIHLVLLKFFTGLSVIFLLLTASQNAEALVGFNMYISGGGGTSQGQLSYRDKNAITGKTIKLYDEIYGLKSSDVAFGAISAGFLLNFIKRNPKESISFAMGPDFTYTTGNTTFSNSGYSLNTVGNQTYQDYLNNGSTGNYETPWSIKLNNTQALVMRMGVMLYGSTYIYGLAGASRANLAFSRTYTDTDSASGSSTQTTSKRTIGVVLGVGIEIPMGWGGFGMDYRNIKYNDDMTVEAVKSSAGAYLAAKGSLDMDLTVNTGRFYLFLNVI